MGRPDIVADPQSPNAVSEYQSLPPPTVTEGTCVLGPTMCGIACPTHRLEGTATSTIEAAEAKVVGDSRVVLKEKLVKNFSVCIHPPPGVLTTRSLPARRVGPPNLLETWADDTSGIRRRKTRTPPPRGQLSFDFSEFSILYRLFSSVRTDAPLCEEYG